MHNAAVAHLQYEAALLKEPAKVGGRSFTATDPNPALQFRDIYLLLATITSFQVVTIPGISILILCHMIEFYHLSRVYFPMLAKLLPPLQVPLVLMQPAMLQVANSHQFANNDEIERELGYKGIYTSMEAMCTEVKEWIDEGWYSANTRRRNSMKGAVEKLGAVSAATRE
jgi:hypothetical protein